MGRPDVFDRADPSADGAFNASARNVVHIEAGAIGALRALYARELPAGESVLDLVSSPTGDDPLYAVSGRST